MIVGDSDASSNPSNKSGEAEPLPDLDTSDDDRFVVGDVSEDEVMDSACWIHDRGYQGVPGNKESGTAPKIRNLRLPPCLMVVDALGYQGLGRSPLMTTLTLPP